MTQHQRRSFFKKLGLGLASLSFPYPGLARLLSASSLPRRQAGPPAFRDDFATTPDRTWIGEKYWAIPLEDWQINGGRLEFTGQHRNSRVNLLTTVLGQGPGQFSLAVEAGLQQAGAGQPGTAGFSIGIRDELDPDVKAACYYGKGLPAGLSTQGRLFIGQQSLALPQNFDFSAFTLQLTGVRENNATRLTLSCQGQAGKATVLSAILEEDIPGLVALVNNFEENGGARFWFRNLHLSGSKTKDQPENTFGPILWAMYTLSKNQLCLTAQLPPLGRHDSRQVELQFQEGGQWQTRQTQPIDGRACLATFRLAGWDATREQPYRLLYKNRGQEYSYQGRIRPEPQGRPLRLGGLTCQEWSGYPYTPVVKNLAKHNPDLLFFSGDQLYEGNGGYPIKREPEEAAILSYLGKWYMFGWAFGEVMRDRPTICTPDDHDVFHGNLWGEGGKLLSVKEWEKVRDAHGGYVQTPNMVNVVAKTQCGHLPAPYNPSPLGSGISTWYTDLVYGRTSFAIISDRMFKSGPDQVRSGPGRIDHLKSPLAHKDQLEDPNLKLLGQGQMQFLQNWVEDWQGADLKVLLSQTLFCNVGTHHGPDKMFLHGDMDSGGWPRKQRDEVIRLVRKACVFHLNGDQHLPFLVQYSLDQPRDAGWTFCTPAISTGYLRWGEPDSMQAPHSMRPAHGLPHTGLYQDGFGNHNYIYAVGNPKDNFAHKNRYLRAQNKASGFGLITLDPAARTIKMEAFRFLADKDKPGDNDTFPGWPLTITQADNDGRKPAAFLPRLELSKPHQVVSIYQGQELVSSIRTRGHSFEPVVFGPGTYRVVVGEGAARQEFTGLKASAKKTKKVLKVTV
ncbi:MAG: alkaline phosphatase D family protein [Adhaeribacter sp.]